VSDAQIQTLARLSSAVLADCAFLLTEPAADSSPLDAGLVHAVVAVHGESGAALILSVPRSLAVQVASDMLGVSPDDPESQAQAEGAIAELANVLVGTLVERFCEGDACEIGLPEVYTGEPPTAAGSDTCTALLRADTGELIRISWAMSARAES
jgi:CheY-specific phosphatase CheX